MARTIEIKKIGTDKLDNSLHVRYHSELYGIVHRFDLTKIGLPNELMNEWDGDLKVEGNINKEALMNVNTELMDKKDVERDNLLTFIFSLIRDYRLSPEASEVEAAKMLYTLIRAYDRIQQKSNDRESADIDGLVTDLRSEKYASHVTTLRLTNAVNKLETVNKEFDAYASKRTQDRTASAKLPPARVARAKTDEVLDQIFFVLQNAYSFGKAPVEKELIATMVDEMNTRTSELNEVYRQSQAQKKAAKQPKDPKTPKEPKQPKEPKEPKQPDTPKDPKDPKQPGKPGEKPKPGGGDGGPDIHLPEE